MANSWAQQGWIPNKQVKQQFFSQTADKMMFSVSQTLGGPMCVCGGEGNGPREMTEDLLHSHALFQWGIYSWQISGPLISICQDQPYHETPGHSQALREFGRPGFWFSALLLTCSFTWDKCTSSVDLGIPLLKVREIGKYDPVLDFWFCEAHCPPFDSLLKSAVHPLSLGFHFREMFIKVGFHPGSSFSCQKCLRFIPPGTQCLEGMCILQLAEECYQSVTKAFEKSK